MTASAPPELQGVHHHWADAGGLRVHYAEAGDPAAEPALLLHGWPQHWYMWREVIGPLAEAGYRVICPDLRGFGWSEGPDGPYGPEVFAADQAALLDSLEIERAHIAGHDWGALTSLFVGIGFPERVRSLVALNTGHPWASPSPRLLREAWRSWYALLNAFAPAPAVKAWTARWVLGHGHVRDPFSPLDEEMFTAQFGTPTGARVTGALYRDYFRLFARGGRGEWEDARLEAPALLLFGARDLYVSTKLAEPPRCDHGPLRIELVPDAGHFIVNEKPVLVTERTLAHFAAATERSTVEPA